MKTYKYILIDWDGTLAKTLHIWLEACRTALANQGLTVTDEDILASFGHLEDTWAEWGISDVQTAVTDAEDLARVHLLNVRLYPHAVKVLEQLHASGKKLAILTSSSHAQFQFLLDKYEIGHLFDTIVAAEDITRHKPDPEPIEIALRLLGGDKIDAIMIGDSDKDLGAANNAGIDSVLYYPEEHTKFYDLQMLEQFKPTYVVGGLQDLMAIL